MLHCRDAHSSSTSSSWIPPHLLYQYLHKPVILMRPLWTAPSSAQTLGYKFCKAWAINRLLCALFHISIVYSRICRHALIWCVVVPHQHGTMFHCFYGETRLMLMKRSLVPLGASNTFFSFLSLLSKISFCFFTLVFQSCCVFESWAIKQCVDI